MTQKPNKRIKGWGYDVFCPSTVEFIVKSVVILIVNLFVTVSLFLFMLYMSVSCGFMDMLQIWS